MRAHQIMTRPVFTVLPDATITEAANLMLQRHISGLPVVNAAGERLPGGSHYRVRHTIPVDRCSTKGRIS